MENNNRNLIEVMRDEMVMQDKILSILRDGPKTIPDIAALLEYPNQDVMIWVMAMWRYGKLIETGKANQDGYFEYKVVQEGTK